MKVIAFAATNSIKSINKQFAQYATKFIDGKGVEIIDINDFDLPIYSSDLEEKFGVPKAANAFLSKISEAGELKDDKLKEQLKRTVGAINQLS